MNKQERREEFNNKQVLLKAKEKLSRKEYYLFEELFTKVNAKKIINNFED